MNVKKLTQKLIVLIGSNILQKQIHINQKDKHITANQNLRIRDKIFHQKKKTVLNSISIEHLSLSPIS